VAEPPRDEFPNNFVGDLVHDERGWVVVPLTRQAIAQKGILRLRTTLRHPPAAAPEARRARGQHIGRPKALDEKKPRWHAVCTAPANRQARLPPLLV
jgi:hypothetical protein